MELLLSVAAARVLLATAQIVTPAPETRISEWVDQGHVILSERTNSPRPGPFGFEGVEYIREPLDRLHPDDPCSRVTVRGGAQTAKSSIGQLWLAWSVANHPKSFAIGLPTAGEVGKYNDYKLQPILEDSPLLRPRVRAVSTKSNEGSSVRRKRLFNGATFLLFNLGSPAELQMISTGNLILEEVANTLREVGARGAPIQQARERQAAYSVVGSKELMVSTPGEFGACEVTKAETAGDQRRFFGPCAHAECGAYFALEPEGFRPARGTLPHHFTCPACGGELLERDMPAFRQAGVWLPCFPSEDEENPAPPAFVPPEDLAHWRARDCEGREPSYYIWQAYCGLISWDKVASAAAAAGTPAELKALEQQTYGRAWDPAVEALAWEDVHRLREDLDRAVVPEAAEILTGFCDVQGAWLEWGVLAWGPGAEWWVIDRGVIEGDTSSPEPWRELDAVVRRKYPHAAGGTLGVEAFGVDTGFRTQKVYGFCRGRATCYAMDGRPGWKAPILGRPKPVKVVENGKVKGRVKLWPSGTWELKSLLAWSLNLSVEAGYQVRLQGRGHWSKAEDEAWAQQITAETLAEEKNAKTGEIDRWWKKIRERNEWVDIWVGARALAWSLGVGAAARDGRPEAADWTARAAARAAAAGAPPPDLFTAAADASAARADSSPPPAPAPRRFYRSRT